MRSAPEHPAGPAWSALSPAAAPRVPPAWPRHPSCARRPRPKSAAPGGPCVPRPCGSGSARCARTPTCGRSWPRWPAAATSCCLPASRSGSKPSSRLVVAGPARPRAAAGREGRACVHGTAGPVPLSLSLSRSHSCSVPCREHSSAGAAKPSPRRLPPRCTRTLGRGHLPTCPAGRPNVTPEVRAPSALGTRGLRARGRCVPSGSVLTPLRERLGGLAACEHRGGEGVRGCFWTHFRPARGAVRFVLASAPPGRVRCLVSPL